MSCKHCCSIAPSIYNPNRSFIFFLYTVKYFFLLYPNLIFKNFYNINTYARAYIQDSNCLECITYYRLVLYVNMFRVFFFFNLSSSKFFLLYVSISYIFRKTVTIIIAGNHLLRKDLYKPNWFSVLILFHHCICIFVIVCIMYVYSMFGIKCV